MAKIKSKPKPNPTEINRFLGVNDTPDGELGLQLGESSNMWNFRITQNYKLKKREGYKHVFEGLPGVVRGMWYGKLNGTTFFLFCSGGHLYKGNLNTGLKTDLGTLTDAPTRFIAFGKKVYLSNGYEYKSFDGTNFIDVVGYRPKLFIATPPAGGGTPYEQMNVLTGMKRMTFSPDGTSTAFHLAEQNNDSVDFVKVDGSTVTTGFTVNATKDIVTFTTPPATGTPDSVEIGWTKNNVDRSFVTKCRFSMDYSGQTDSRVFLWGHPDYINRRFWSSLADGVPSAEYFEVTSFDDLGSGQYAITDIVKQYDTQKIFFEDSAMYAKYDVLDGIVSFPAYELNEEVGNVAYGQMQIINNSPFSIYNGVHAWQATTVKDQTNESLVSERVQDSLTAENLTQAITYNWQENHEYWLCIGSKVWIFNYLANVWYKFDNIPAKCFLVIGGKLYFGTSNSIEVFDKAALTDNGTVINAVWEMRFYDFGREWQKKFMRNIWVSLNPATKAKCDIQYVTDNNGTSDIQTIYYNLSTFSHMDFSHFSFATSYNPQPFYLEIQAQQFVYFKLIIKNTSLTDVLTVLSINMPIRYGGKVR